MTLFDYAERYPSQPGYKRRETSRDAATAMKPKAKRLQGLVLDALAQYGALTADEIADKLSIDKLSIRPRLSELAAQYRVVDTGQRRANESGKRAVVWSLPALEMAA